MQLVCQERVFLSIDLDFWHLNLPARECLTLLFKRCRDIPLLAVTSHEQLLGAVDQSGANHLVNVDEHDDLVNLKEGLSDGNWVGRVRWKGSGTYTWVGSYDQPLNFNTHPRGLVRADRLGRVDLALSPQDKPWDHRSGWQKTVFTHAEQYVDLCQYLTDCVGIGLCLSPGYAPLKVQEILQQLTRDHGVPILGEDPWKGENARDWGRPKLAG
jgi:hypothetical protein